MKVRALRLGYYKERRRTAGQTFRLLDPEHFSKNWMEKVEAEKVETPAPVKKKAPAKKKVAKKASPSVDLNKEVI